VDIVFTNTLGYKNIEPPTPATKMLPDWYKEMDSYLNGEKLTTGVGINTGTIKRCMPVFDAIVAGYIITLPADVAVYLKDGEQRFHSADFNLIDFHPIEQAPTHPVKNKFIYPKWINVWSIKTPPGYSTLFVTPMHHSLPFTILPGIVDTDKYTAPVNFPFVINDINFEGIIPKGTPIAQVIPFKRDPWEIKIGGFEEMQEQTDVSNILKTKFFDRYKNAFRSSKEYK
jgi:hypothetical protein